MKRLSVTALTAILALGLALTFSACSSGGGGGSGSDPGTGPVTNPTTTAGSTSQPSAITNNTQGTQAASSSMQGSSMSQGSGQTFRNLGNVGLSATGAGAPEFKTSATFKPSPAMKKVIKTTGKFARSRSANAAASSVKRAVSVLKAQASNAPTSGSGSGTCTDGGTYTYSVSATGNDFTADLTFTACRENDSQTDGLYKMTGTATQTGGATLNITLGTDATPFTLMDFGTGYSGLITKSTMTAFTLGITMAADASSVTMTMAASGGMNVKDFFSGDEFTVTFANNFTDAFSMATGGAGTPAPTNLTFSITTNGDFSESYTSGSVTNGVSASFQALKLDVSINSVYEQLDLNGQFTIAFTPASCMNGTFKFVTSPSIRADLATGKYTQGVMTINDTTTCTYNSDGTITVKTGADSKTYQGEYDLYNECPMATMDEPAPVSSGTTGTAAGGITATLTWDSPSSDMDFHLAHYVTKPIGTAVIPLNDATGVTTNSDWHLYFGTGPGGACSSGNYIGTSLNPIADYDIDDCTGYGPEHITLVAPPSGYYILFVNPWSMSNDISSTVDVSLQVGGSMFTFPSHTFTSSSDADYVACTFTVDAAGNVTVGPSVPMAAPAFRANKFQK